MDEGVLSRRSVLKTAAQTTAALALAPIARAVQNDPPKRPIVGKGEHTYEVYHDWLTPPANLMWGDTHGLALDRQGRIYLAHTVHDGSVSSDAIVVYDQQGKLIDSWGSEFRGGAHGLDIRKEGSEEYLYHCDVNRCVIAKTDLNGKLLWEKGCPTESGVYPGPGKWRPTNIAFHPEGDIFVADGYGSSYIHRYTKDGEWKSVVIKPGHDAGFVQEPHGLWVDLRTDPKLVVADRANHRLQEFTFEGKHLGFVTEGMRRPCHIHYNHDLVLVPDLQSVVTILGKNNEVVAQLGDGDPSNLRGAPRDKFIPGKFVHPHAAIWINKRDILVVEWVPIGRVTLLKRVG